MQQHIISKTIVMAGALLVTGLTNMSCKPTAGISGNNISDKKQAATIASANAQQSTISTVSLGGASGEQLKQVMTAYEPALNENLKGIATVEAYDEGLVVTMTKGSIFPVDSYVINESAKADLLRVAYSLNQMPETFVLIGGHTDATGSNAHNDKLSRKRAVQVANYLKSAGVDETRLLVDGFGEKVPKFSNRSFTGRDKNRRVDFIIVADNTLRENVVNNGGRR